MERPIMAQDTLSKKSATATFSFKGQNIEGVQKVVTQILGMAGCTHCGRLAVLRVDFLGDPPPDLAAGGVVQFEKQGF
jgi:hypothetical protein